MKNIIRILLCSTMLVWMTNSKAEIQFGFGLMAGQLDTSGTETEGTAADTSVRNKSFEEAFAGADIFIENIFDNGFTVGLSYVPLNIDVGDGSRQDNAGGDVPGEADTGTRTASAEVADLVTLYTNVPLGGAGWYGLLGGHMATVETTENLPNSSYGNEDITGYQVGLGKRVDKAKFELFYSDFEDISISSTGGNSNSVSADADAVVLRLSIGF